MIDTVFRPSPRLGLVEGSEEPFEALDELQDLGGSCKLAATARWSPEAHDKAAGQLVAVPEAVEAELTQLELRARHFPRDRRLG
jgi:hypothetical protein